MSCFVFRLLIVFVWVALTAFRAPYLPQSAFCLEHEGYIVCYDGRTRNAFWVYERLTRDSFIPNRTERKNLHYRIDKKLPLTIRSTIDDYRGSGYDLGHLCPYADWRGNPTAAVETFLMSNISPQAAPLNRGLWRSLEKYLRCLTEQYSELHVITIPLYLPEDGYVIYPVIGENQVAVPTHFCKVVFAEKEDTIDQFVFLLPNRELPKDALLEEFQTTLENIERLSGIIFLPTSKGVE